jgi:tetratricopeptide (TPR) repeat protein
MHAAAWQFCDTLWGWLGHRHDYPAWRQVCEQAIQSARACGDARAEVFAAIRLASCHIASGQAEAAAAIAAQAIQTAWINGDRAGEGSAREHAGICAATAGHYQEAVTHFTRGLDCWRRITRHQRAEAILHRQLGRALHGLGQHQDASAHLDTALAIFTGLGERYHQARTMYVIASYQLTGSGPADAAEAITLLNQARPLLEADDHPLSLSELLMALAEAYARTGNTSQARTCMDQATTLQQQLSLPATHPARARASDLAAHLTQLASRPPGNRHDGSGAPGEQAGDHDA